MNKLNHLKKYAPIAVRFGVGIVFLLLGIDQVLHSEGWTNYLPSWVISLLPSWETPAQFMFHNGLFDCLIGLTLIAGIYVRVFSGLAVLHLAGVITVLGYNDVAIRDLGILLAALSVFCQGADEWCLIRK